MIHVKKLVHFIVLFVTLVAICVVIERGAVYIGKTYEEAYYVEEEAHIVAQKLATYELHPLTHEHFEQYLIVTAQDLDAYRRHLGTLSEQLAAIEAEYAQQLEGATHTVASALQQERDEKLADVTRIFEDDAYVKEKVLELKKQVVEQIIEEEKAKRHEELGDYAYYSYDLYDSEAVQHATFGNPYGDVMWSYSIEEGQLENVTRTFLISAYDVPALQPISYTVQRSMQHVSGTVMIANDAPVPFAAERRIFNMMQYVVYGAIAVIVIGLVYVYRVRRAIVGAVRANNPLSTYTASVPIDVLTFSLLGIIYVVWSFIYSLSYVPGALVVDVVNERISVYEWTKQLTWATLIFAWFLATLYAVHALIERIVTTPHTALWQQTAIYKGISIIKSASANRSIAAKIVIWMIAFSASSFFLGQLIGVYSATEVVVVLALVLLLLFFLLLHRVGQLNEIIAYTADVANGYTPKALTIRGNHALAKHSEYVQTLRDGMRHSVREQQKSERLKTELITNVSHDLRTPLTAIMTYTELLKQDITEEERQQYVAIVDAKASRLKTLIEDLFEVSKMASGDVDVQRSKVDVAQLLQQAIGEHKEAFEQAQLDVRLNIAQSPIDAYIDAQKWWRMLDNLLINAYKYSLANTRVYIQLRLEKDELHFSIKNVANYALNEDATELIERFKRADTARHTEGSGLGLAIAASIVDLHQGNMTIDVDGDLFKVTVRMPRAI